MTSVPATQQEKNEVVIQTAPALTSQPSALPDNIGPIPCPYDSYNPKQDPKDPSLLPVSEVNKSTYLACHWCLRCNWTGVVTERGWSTYMCTYLACQFTCIPCIGWNWTRVMDQRHYCGSCGNLLVMRQGAPGIRKDKGLKVYTKLGSVRLKPGEILAQEHWNEEKSAETVLFVAKAKQAIALSSAVVV